MEYKGYIIAESRGSGKACRGLKKTSTIQVQDYSQTLSGFQLKKQFQFKVSDLVDKNRAIHRAKKFIDSL
jgi:hypothetical protein